MSWVLCGGEATWGQCHGGSCDGVGDEGHPQAQLGLPLHLEVPAGTEGREKSACIPENSDPLYLDLAHMASALEAQSRQVV